MIDVMFGERVIQQIQAQHAVFVGGQFEGFLAGLDLLRHHVEFFGQGRIARAAFLADALEATVFIVHIVVLIVGSIVGAAFIPLLFHAVFSP